MTAVVMLRPPVSTHRAVRRLARPAAPAIAGPASRRRLASASLAVSIIIMAALFPTAPAHAACPDNGSPDRTVCDFWNALLMPSVTALSFLPLGEDAGNWYGAGIQLGFYTWSDNDPRRGASQGRYLFDLGILRADSQAGDNAGTMLRLRGGHVRSFEGNASRTWLIPFYGLSAGLFNSRATGFHGFAEGSLGVHALYTPRLIINLEAGYSLPTADIGRLSGPSLQLVVSAAWW